MNKHLHQLAFLALLLLGQTSFAQNILKGTIKDKNGKAIPDAIIAIKGTKFNTSTDTSGVYQLNTPNEFPFTLVVNSVGYKRQEVQVYELASAPTEFSLEEDGLLGEVVVTSRRREEIAQNIPIAISVLDAKQIENGGAFNVNRAKEFVPSVQLYSSNPRNTTLNIRGLGSTFGLTNDGLDPGVGFYVDGVYYARAAATTLDFIDVEQIEVLRGPQGTLFGKNTAAGAFNITTRKPTFAPSATLETSYGNYGYIQGKASVSGAINKIFAARLSFSGTSREGTIENVTTRSYTNTMNNLGLKGQLLFKPNDKLEIILSIDGTRQRPDGYAQVVAGITPTLRPAYRQFDAIAADLNYKLPSTNPFDRKIDTDVPWRSDNDLYGGHLNIDYKLGKGKLTSTTAYRKWDWGPSNDRDFTGLKVLTKSQNPSIHNQFSQEFRYAGEISKSLSGSGGIFLLSQEVITYPGTEESGKDQWRFSRSSLSNNWTVPGLLDGFGTVTRSSIKSFTGAIFGQVDWAITEKIHLLPGIRFNYDNKDVDYNRQTYGGLQTTNTALLAIKKGIYSDQAYKLTVNEFNVSWNITAAHRASERLNAYATWSTSYKPVGVNVAGIPNNSAGEPDLNYAKVKPEFVNHFEVGVKTRPTSRTTFNISGFYTSIKDYQTQVQTAELNVNRGYLANAEQVRVSGVEVDASIKVKEYLSLYGNFAFTDGVYVTFKNAPLPLEETGATASFKDISGSQLPGISKYAGNIGGELSLKGKFFGQTGKYFLNVNVYGRSGFSSSNTPSRYLNIDGYNLLNGSIGFRTSPGFTVFVWGRNILNTRYHEQLLPAGGGTGIYASVLGDPVTYGITVRANF